jgi:tetratricopeptide (TPR) repeat protein
MNRRHVLAPILATSVALTLCGCASRSMNPASPYATQNDVARNPLRAQELTLQAADLIERHLNINVLREASRTQDHGFVEPPSKAMPDDFAKAESLLREALAADLYHGPAHNNLGVIYLKQGKLYEAANEFEWARKLLPGHPDPRMNLAMVLERAGRTDDALATYRTALEVYPDHLPTLQARTRLQLKSNKRDESTNAHLQQIAMRSSPQWREWALKQLSR